MVWSTQHIQNIDGEIYQGNVVYPSHQIPEVHFHRSANLGTSFVSLLSLLQLGDDDRKSDLLQHYTVLNDKGIPTRSLRCQHQPLKDRALSATRTAERARYMPQTQATKELGRLVVST